MFIHKNMAATGIRSLVKLFIFIVIFTSSQMEGALEQRLLTNGVFSQGVIVGQMTAPVLSEASGCAASRTHPGLLYTLNDHGGKNEVYVLSTNGTLIATYDIPGAKNTDWEDIALGPCDSSNSTVDCIYIADTGDTGSANTLYRFEEPYFVEDRDVHVEAELRFSWNEDDCETIMVDPKANVYLISKDLHGRGVLFHVPNSAWSKPGSHSQRVHISSLAAVPAPSTHHDPVGGDISPNGNEVLVKVHEGIYYWNMHGSRDYEAAMILPGVKVPYIQELQGESVCWNPSGSGYYTLSEGTNQPIYYYAKV